MPRSEVLALLASSLLVACPGTDAPEQSTGDPSPTSATGEPGATSSGTAEPTGPGTTVDATTGPDASETGGTSGTSGTSGTGELGTTDGGTDTGAAACEPSWVVPEVAADALAQHDLAWVGCELTACGPEDRPARGEPSLLCAELAIADIPLTYLGHMHPNETGAFTTDIVSANNFGWLDGLRHVYRYDERVYILTEADDAVAQLQVFYAARALEGLRGLYPGVYPQLVDDALEFPAGPTLPGLGWKNRLRSVVISFDSSPQAIAAGVTVLDAAPVEDMQTGLDGYSNVAAISIDRETILGASEAVGSRPIYARPSADENFLRYMREGLAETLVHELLHVRIDRLNSVDADMKALYDRRGQQGLCAQWELEEALVAATSLLLFRERGGLSDTYLDFYDVVLDANLALIASCPDYPTWAGQFSHPSGVDARYDLRLFDLE